MLPEVFFLAQTVSKEKTITTALQTGKRQMWLLLIKPFLFPYITSLHY